MKDWLGVGHMIGAFKNSFCGFKVAFCDGCAFRQEIVLGVIEFALLPFVKEGPWVKMGLVAGWGLLLATELMNTAVEAVVDLASPEWHKLAKQAKDCASAAVFVVGFLNLAAWVLVGFRFLRNLGYV